MMQNLDVVYRTKIIFWAAYTDVTFPERKHLFQELSAVGPSSGWHNSRQTFKEDEDNSEINR